MYSIVLVWLFTIQKKKKAFKLKDCSSLIELLSSSMLLEQEFLVGINLFSSYICIFPYISKT